jgi:hypothetical protein
MFNKKNTKQQIRKEREGIVGPIEENKGALDLPLKCQFI